MTPLSLMYSTAIPQQIDEKPQQKKGNRGAPYTTGSTVDVSSSFFLIFEA